VLMTHNRMLEVQIAQKDAFSSALPDRLPSKPEPNPRKQYNYVTMKKDAEDLTDSKEVPMEEGREVTMAGSKENNYGGKTVTFVRMTLLRSQPFFPLSFITQEAFSSKSIMGKVGIERGLCDLGASVSIMPYSLFHKVH